MIIINIVINTMVTYVTAYFKLVQTYSVKKKMTSKFWAELSSDYEKLFETELGYDVIIYIGEEPNVKEVHAHSNILCVRSQYFRSAFYNEWAKKKDGKFIFKKSNISPHLFNIILR